ncbi:EAL domain-containing protein [bacterium]|nr:MAG: EAL domain-containing protein [bacterium]
MSRTSLLGKCARTLAVSISFIAAWNLLNALSRAVALAQPGVPAWYLPPTLSLFAVLAFGVGYAPLILVAHAVSLLGQPFAAARSVQVLTQGVLDMLIYGGTGLILMGPLGYDPLRRRIRDMTNVVVVAGLLATLCAAAASALYAAATGMAEWQHVPATIAGGWIGRAAGTVAILPFLVVYGTPLVRRLVRLPVPQRRRVPSLAPLSRVETIGQALSTAAILTLAYAVSTTGSQALSFLYFYFLPLAWIVVRRGLSGAIVVNAATELAVIVLSTWFGYTAAATTGVQEFMLGATLTSLLMGGVVSARARMERQLRAAQEQLSRAEEASSTMVLHVGIDAHCRKTPPAFSALLKRTPGETRAEPLVRFVAPDDRPAVQRALQRIIDGEAHAADLQARFVDGVGHQHWLHLNMSGVRDMSGRPEFVLVFANDITSQRLESEEVAYLAYHDALTGLPNRSMLDEHLAPALERARRSGRAVAAVFVDLDGFKAINDSLGHATGDAVLQVAASRLRHSARATDLVVRLSGDEFLVMISDIERVGAGEGSGGYAHVPLAVSANIHRSLTQPIDTARGEISIQASIGVSIFPTDAQDGETLVRHADEAMYLAKRAGTGRTQRFGELADAQTQDALSLRLFHAAERHEFVVYFQPIVDLRSAGPELARGGIVGAEALLRWCDRDVLTTPASFLPYLESSGLIESVGTWANREAIRHAAPWLESGLLRVLSLNLSLVQLARVDGAAQLLALLREARVDPKRVVVEIPEAVTTEGHQGAERTVRALCDAGIRIAVDGYGAGSSSITALRRMGAGWMKIDHALVERVDGDEAAGAVIATLLGVAEGLRMEAVAEGVESDAQRRRLVDLGCLLGQGFLFSAPVPAGEMERLLSRVSMV